MPDRKKDLKQAYKEMKTDAGVYQIKNTINQKLLVVATPNLKTLEGKRFQLQLRSHKNAQLQAEWNEFGEVAFVFEVLELLDDKAVGEFAQKEALHQLEQNGWTNYSPTGSAATIRRRVHESHAKMKAQTWIQPI